MMSNSKPTYAALFFFLIFISMASFKSSYCMTNNANNIVCQEIEKQSLVNFKQSLKDPDNILLSSWDGEIDCCKWKGVVCNNLTGHVHQLRLRCREEEDDDEDLKFQCLSGEINPSLLNLKHLRYLDLSRNNFSGETIPSFIGSFTNLEYLNLSAAGFHGKVPQNIGNLSNLHTLDLRPDGREHSQLLEVDSLEWLSGLRKLEYLNMNYADLSKATNWAQVINSLPSLLQLHFQYCSLDITTPSMDFNTTSITHLDLSLNDLESSALLSWIFQLRNLVYLDLSINHFGGPISPALSNATKLQHIDLLHNYFNSTIPDWLYFCKELKFVSLRQNLLQGTISHAIANLTSLSAIYLSGNQLSGKIPKEIANLCRTRILDLSNNELRGEISDSFGDMSDCFLGALEYLSLQNNNISGHLTDHFTEFKSLQYLDLGSNSLSGAIPISIGKLSSLQQLYIDDNKLEGVVTERHFANLTKLEVLYATGNHLTLNVSSNWTPSLQLQFLRIGSWNLGVGSQFPSWLENHNHILELDLSNTGITGSVPGWIWKIPFLDLSHNYLTGNIPEQVDCRYMYLSSNKFSGSLPRIGDTTQELDLSNNSFSGGISHLVCDMRSESYVLRFLHLGENQLNGELPDCWMKWPSLNYLNIGHNNISGSIPNSIGFLADLQCLNLGGNKISGQIPFSMQNNTRLLKVDLSNNDLDGNIPTWIGKSLVLLRGLIIRSNKLSGKISTEICLLNSLQLLDLSDNQFSGIIPKCVYNFTAMATKRRFVKEYYYERTHIFLYMSRSMYEREFTESATVATKGTKLQYDTIVSLVTHIDLSKNNLSGGIPKELTSLVELRSLNLSENNLTGVIPDSIGNMKQLESLDFSRNSLSGQIPISFTLLSSLAYLNLSYNKLTGRIPESTQLQSFTASSFTGNDLCGPPLTSNCRDDGDEVDEHDEDNEGDESKIEWFYVSISLGYAVGFSVVCTTLALKKSWREAYYGLLECIRDKVYVYACINWRRLTKPSGTSSLGHI